jgi:hypothetical protein
MAGELGSRAGNDTLATSFIVEIGIRMTVDFATSRCGITIQDAVRVE